MALDYRISQPARLMAAGFAAYWLPRIVLAALDPADNAAPVLTWLPPCCFLAGWVIVYCWRRMRQRRFEAPPASAAFFMLCGVWVLSGVGGSLTVWATKRFAMQASDAISPAIVLLGILPPYAYIIAAYNGTLFALLITTGFGIALHLAELRHWVIPPRSSAARSIIRAASE